MASFFKAVNLESENFGFAIKSRKSDASLKIIPSVGNYIAYTDSDGRLRDV